MSDNDTVGIVIQKLGEPVVFSGPIYPGEIVKIAPQDAGNIIAMRVGYCCLLSEELSKIPKVIQKKIVALMRLAGSNIKVDWEE